MQATTVLTEGAQGTSIIGLFDGAIAWTGAREKALRQAGRTAIEKIYLHPNSHAGCFPGATPIAVKAIFSTHDGRVLGVQALGRNGVDKLVNAFAMAIQMGACINDLAEAELCCSPQFGSAKDPANFVGMVAQGVLAGDAPVAHWGDECDAVLLDVREAAELTVEAVHGAINIPLRLLRSRLGELPGDKDTCVICRSGQRAYCAARVLIQNGYRARVLSGGMLARFHSGVLES